MKTAIVTGASSEIGMEICNSLGQDGYRVICQYASKEEDLLLQSKKYTLIPVRADFSTYDGILRFIDFVEKNVDSVDVIIHCAAQVEKKIKDLTEDVVFSTICNVNLLAPILITRKIVNKMEKGENPNLIFISSTYSKRLGSLKSIYYSSTKSALSAVSRIFAQEFPSVRSNVIIPGYVDTETYRLDRSPDRIEEDKKLALNKRLVSPREVSDTVGFILKNRAINGTAIEVNGGLCL